MRAEEINRLLLLDTESTGLDPNVDVPIEIAVTLYDIEHNAPIASFASLLYASGNEAEEINRIPASLLTAVPSTGGVWETVRELAEMADVIVAHRAEHDILFVPEALKTIRPWACSKNDMDWPRGRPGRGDGLAYLALAHGVPVISAHRAMADVDTLTRTFQMVRAAGHDVRGMVARSMRPKATFIALVPYAEKDKAKEAGFQWDGEAKTWSKKLFLDEAAKLPFKTKKVA